MERAVNTKSFQRLQDDEKKSTAKKSKKLQKHKETKFNEINQTERSTSSLRYLQNLNILTFAIGNSTNHHFHTNNMKISASITIFVSLMMFRSISCARLNKCKVKCYKDNIICMGMAEGKGDMLQCLINKYKCKENCYKEKISTLKIHISMSLCDKVKRNGRRL